MTEATGEEDNVIVKWTQEDVETLYNLLNKWKLVQGVQGGTVGWGTALQAEWSRGQFSMVSLEFFSMALELTQPATEMNTRNISWGVKAAGA